MVCVPSTMLPLGTTAPNFELLNVKTGEQQSLKDCTGSEGTFIMFLSRHCPFVKHLEQELASIADEYAPKGINSVAISPNDVANYPDDAPEMLIEQIERVRFNFPYLYDEDQSVAKAYRAACTPDFFLFDGDQKLVYRGQIDSSRPGNDIPVSGSDIRAALDAILGRGSMPENQKASVGCNIKWKAGNAPDYFNQ